MTNILVADDHTIMRQGLVQLLADSDEFAVVAQAADGFEVLKHVRSGGLNLNLIVLDMTMPGRHGIDLIKQIRSEQPALKIVVLSMHREPQYALRAMQAGASAYLTKESAADELIEAIRKVLTGETYINASIARALAMGLVRPETRPALSELSNREFQVLVMIANGKALNEIAATLNLSAKTISTYKARILEKLQLHDTAALIRYAIEQDLIEDRRTPPASPV